MPRSVRRGSRRGPDAARRSSWCWTPPDQGGGFDTRKLPGSPGPAAERSRPAGAMPTSSSIRICLRTTGSAHATSPAIPMSTAPRATSRTTISLGSVRRLTLTPGLRAEKSRKTGGIRTRLGVWLAASVSSPMLGAFSASSAQRMASRVTSMRAACEATILPAAVNSLPRRSGSPASARSPSPGFEDASTPMADRSHTVQPRPRSTRSGQSRAEAAASGDGRCPTAYDAAGGAAVDRDRPRPARGHVGEARLRGDRRRRLERRRDDRPLGRSRERSDATILDLGILRLPSATARWSLRPLGPNRQSAARAMFAPSPSSRCSARR